MRKTNSISFKDKKKFALLVDGDCEFWYFQMLKRNNRGLSVDLKPEIPQRKKLSEQYKKVLEYADIMIFILSYSHNLKQRLQTPES